MIKGILVALPILAIATLSLLGFNYQLHSRETADLDATARMGAPGNFVKIPNGVVHYELGGPENGRLIVLVPGFSVPYYLWDGTFEALEKSGYRVLRYDLFGRGLSDRPDVTYDAALYDNQLSDLLSALRLGGKIDFAGSSMGGAIVTEFACRHPEMVRTITLFDPAFPEGGQLPFDLRAPWLDRYVYDTQISPTLPEKQMTDFAHPEKFPDWAERYRPQMRFKGFRGALLSTLQNFMTTDRTQDFACLGRGSAPVFMTWGQGDKTEPVGTSRKVKALIPRAELLVVDDAGHLPFLERPEVVDPAWFRFLSAH